MTTNVASSKQQDRLLGNALVIPLSSYSVITEILIIFIAATTALFVNGTYARKETVQGFLAPDTSALKTFASRTGIAREIFIQEGDMVTEDLPVAIRYSVFNFKKIGLYDAIITGVSQTALLPTELLGLSRNTQEPMFRVTEKLDKQNVETQMKLAEGALFKWLF